MPNENTINLAWRHAHTIVDLPEPPVSFEVSETTLTHAEVQLFRENDIIEKANGSTSVPHEWQVTETAWEKAEEHVENTETFDCCDSSRGVSNVDGELVCQNCGATVTKAEFRRVHR